MKIKSADLGLGVPFNTTQYAILVHLIAQVTGLKPGIFTHIMNNSHIYENQFEGISEQIDKFNLMEKLDILIKNDNLVNCLKKSYSDIKEEEFNRTIKVLKSVPKLKINPDIKDFYDFTIDDINLEDYESLDKIKMPVSI